MRTQIRFLTPSLNGWIVYKTFNDESHMNNYINYIMRTKGFTLDEIYMLDEKNLCDAQ